MPLVETAVDGRIATVTLNRPDKRNAISDPFIAALEAAFDALPDPVRVVILTGAGDHFCAGLDLAEHAERTPEAGIYHSRNWHRILDQIQFGARAVVSAMQGAVIGGGLEIAAATHVRVADATVRFQLPEGRRGIFVGGGATVRVGRILGADRMTEMMLTGRTYGAEEGVRLGLAHYAVDAGAALPLARELAEKVADNAPLSNYFMIQALARIEDMSKADGLFTESLCAALSQTSPDAQEGLRAFLEKRTPRFR
ncbi:MAG: crotonase/enoyl-CoA hydratase family protein [Proteobacteria bacterium]|nr:crotonase/enoyl-CoA hydratase family protein [Pseudomonadota bacterium]